MQILENISFSVESGEVLEILGPNGVGKTTLLRCMMGLLPWISGQSTLDGKPLREIPVKRLWSRISCSSGKRMILPLPNKRCRRLGLRT